VKEKVVLPPHGFVQLESALASDLDVVRAARISFRRSTETLSEADEKLIAYLMREEHGTPFEHNYFRFQVRAPIFVLREWHRHRIGASINEESGRYVELREEGWTPEPDEIRVRRGRPGHYQYETASREIGQEAAEGQRNIHQAAFAEYRRQIELGVAPEVARNVLPVATYSEMIWSCNARSLMHFLHLRNAPEAQREIRLYAEALEEFFAEEMPVTHQAFVQFGRRAP
jgi:thymidylate synthase (FAD)